MPRLIVHSDFDTSFKQGIKVDRFVKPGDRIVVRETTEEYEYRAFVKEVDGKTIWVHLEDKEPRYL